MGSFRLAAGRGYLHPQYNFAESLVETARMLLCHSCRSELTRQGISLVWPSRDFRERRTLSWLAAIHLRSDLANPRDAFARQMLALLHHQKNVSKLEKINVLLR